MKSMILVVVAIVTTTAISFQLSPPPSVAQEPSPTQIQYGDAEIPAAALLTNRGRQLVDELQNLRRALSRLGTKHPTRKVIEDQIVAIRRELTAWVSASEIRSDESLGENPFDPPSHPMPRINQTDLRELVLTMSERIEALEQRVRKLERAR